MAVTLFTAPEIPPERAVKTATVTSTTSARTTAYSAIVWPSSPCWKVLRRLRRGESVTESLTPSSGCPTVRILPTMSEVHDARSTPEGRARVRYRLSEHPLPGLLAHPSCPRELLRRRQRTTSGPSTPPSETGTTWFIGRSLRRLAKAGTRGAVARSFTRRAPAHDRLADQLS